MLVGISHGPLLTLLSVVRCNAIFQALVYTGDVAWYGYSIWETSVVEVLVGLSVSSLPAVKYIFRNYFDNSPSTDDSSLKEPRLGGPSMLESAFHPTRTMRTKKRAKSHFMSFSEQEALEIIALEAKLKPKEAESSVSDLDPTPATKLEEAFAMDVADLPQRTPSCQEEMLRKMGVIAPDQWQWDVSDLQERTPSRQERDLREAGIIKKDEWQDWDGGRILHLGEEYFKSSLLQEGIMSPLPGKMDDQPDYFAGFELMKAAEQKKPMRENSLSQISP